MILCDLATVCRFKDAVTKVKDSLLAQGYPSFTLEDFHDTVRCKFVGYCGISKHGVTICTVYRNFGVHQ